MGCSVFGSLGCPSCFIWDMVGCLFGLPFLCCLFCGFCGFWCFCCRHFLLSPCLRLLLQLSLLESFWKLTVHVQQLLPHQTVWMIRMGHSVFPLPCQQLYGCSRNSLHDDRCTYSYTHIIYYYMYIISFNRIYVPIEYIHIYIYIS